MCIWSRDDLVHTYCSLFDNIQNYRYHRNLSALLLGQVTLEKDKEQIVCSMRYSLSLLQDQETVANQNVVPMEQAQIVKIEQEPAPYNSTGINEVMAETDSGVSDLHNTGIQSVRTQEERVMNLTVR
eukprot:g33576.t1